METWTGKKVRRMHCVGVGVWERALVGIAVLCSGRTYIENSNLFVKELPLREIFSLDKVSNCSKNLVRHSFLLEDHLLRDFIYTRLYPKRKKLQLARSLMPPKQSVKYSLNPLKRLSTPPK